MENVIERSKRLGTEKKIKDFKAKQKLPYEETGKYGWGRVFDYIGVEWENEII